MISFKESEEKDYQVQQVAHVPIGTRECVSFSTAVFSCLSREFKIVSMNETLEFPFWGLLRNQKAKREIEESD